jgi:hypothetical protein
MTIISVTNSYSIVKITTLTSINLVLLLLEAIVVAETK